MSSERTLQAANQRQQRWRIRQTTLLQPIWIGCDLRWLWADLLWFGADFRSESAWAEGGSIPSVAIAK
jgi:hypothetical protein